VYTIDSEKEAHHKRKDNNMKNEIIETHTDRNGNKWERKIMTNFVGEKYAVLYKNGKKVEVLGRIW
jgi:hypothetical protein